MKNFSRLRRFGVVAGVVLLSVSAAAGQSDTKKLAVVNGEVVTEAQIRLLAKPSLDDLELRHLQTEASYARDQQAAIENALNSAIERRLLQAEAKKRGVTEQALVTLEVDSHVIPPTEAEVNGFYEENKSRITGGASDVPTLLKQVRDYLTKQRRDALYAAFIDKLKKDYNVETFLEPQRYQIETQGYPARGPANASVTIVEFSDFECPYCGNLFPILGQIEKNYGDKLRVVYRQFPMTSLHPHAQKAAEASLCANEQNKFWDLHDAMFGDQKNLTVDDLKKKAQALNMDMQGFSACLDSSREMERVKKDVYDGAKVGVTGTPAMFINGRYVSGVHPYEEIAKIIDEELQRVQTKQNQ